MRVQNATKQPKSTIELGYLIKAGSRSVNLRRVFDLRISGMHQIQVISEVWIINGQNVITCM